MYEIAISKYYEATVVIQQTIHMAKDTDPSNLMQPKARTSTIEMLNKARDSMSGLHVPVTKLALDELRERLSWFKQEMPYYACGALLLSLSETMRRELQTVKVFGLDSARVRFYEPHEPLYGTEVDARFPSVAYEIDQAGKCYAFDVTTASAFHSIRSLEAGIRAVARCLNIPDPTRGSDRNWSNVSRSIKAELDNRWPPASGRMSGDGQIFDEIYGSLAGLQNPYRNATMHLEAKYTAPEALHIFEMVKAFYYTHRERVSLTF